MSIQKYKFSVIIPIYNVEEYLEETIESVVTQDIGFEENIQIILVNDGSKDNSEEICLEYQRRYPQNIIYIKQENAGVSAARNHGMDYVEGKYVNFLDADDKWSSDAFSKVYHFFEQHENEINLVSCKQEFFEAKTGLHILSREKYKSDRIIDILDEFQAIQFHITASFIKASAMRLVKFDTNMNYGEDGIYVTQQILEKHKYGVVVEPTHYYRRRENQSSALQGKELKKEWYFQTPELFYQKMVDISLEKFRVVIPYVQYALCYDLQWRLKDPIEKILTEEEQKQYVCRLQKLLRVCDDDIILMQKGIDVRKRLFMLSLKYGKNVTDELVYREGKLFWKQLVVYNVRTALMVKTERVEEQNEKIVLSGKLNLPFANMFSFYFMDDERAKYPLTIQEKKQKILGKEIDDEYIYQAELPLQKSGKIELIGRYQENYYFRPMLSWENENDGNKFGELCVGNSSDRETRKNKYEICVIVRVAKSEKMLKRTMDSLIEQTMPFSEKIQVILFVDENVPRYQIRTCLSYMGKYFRNVRIQWKKLRMSAVKSRYVNYVQEGQYWSLGAFAEAEKMYKGTAEEVSFLLEAYKDEQKGQVANNHLDYAINCAQTFKEETGVYLFARKFDDYLEKIVSAEKRLERVYWLIQILTEANGIAVLENAKLYGRRMQFPPKMEEWYEKELPQFKEKLDRLKENANEARKRQIEYCLMYQLAETMKDEIWEVLTEEKTKTYESWLREAIKELEDDIINNGNMNGVTRKYAFSLKYGENIEEKLIVRNGKLLYRNMIFYSFKSEKPMQIIDIAGENGKLVVRATVQYPFSTDRIELFLEEKGTEYIFDYRKDTEKVGRCLSSSVMKEMEYQCELPLEKEGMEMQVCCRIDGLYPVLLEKMAMSR